MGSANAAARAVFDPGLDPALNGQFFHVVLRGGEWTRKRNHGNPIDSTRVEASRDPLAAHFLGQYNLPKTSTYDHRDLGADIAGICADEYKNKMDYFMLAWVLWRGNPPPWAIVNQVYYSAHMEHAAFRHMAMTAQQGAILERIERIRDFHPYP